MIRCNNCYKLFDGEDALVWLEDEDGEFQGCPVCKTDAYLMDDPIVTSVVRCADCGSQFSSSQVVNHCLSCHGENLYNIVKGPTLCDPQAERR